jgi:hypothetical protein
LSQRRFFFRAISGSAERVFLLPAPLLWS